MASPAGSPNTPFDNLFRSPPSSPAGGNFTTPYPAPPPPLPPSSYPASSAFSYPPPTSPFHHRFLHYPPQHDNNPLNIPTVPYPPPPNPTPNPIPNPGARLMALLGTSSPPNLETAVSLPPSAPAELATPPMIHMAVPSAPPMATAASMKVPRGRHLAAEEQAVHDVDSRLPGESQPPQLEVTPITKYTSDPGLVLGRQIAVNRTYICYGLRLGNIRVLNINTALRSLLKGHTQKVTDMAFFAEDVHLLASASVDGRVFVWKIDEGPDLENKPQITGIVVIALQLVGDAESFHPRVCWHSHKQEILIVGIGKSVLKIDMTKIGRGKEFSADEPLKCPLDKLVDGVQLIGRHDGEVTDLSISQWMTTRLASASKDGTVKIWDDHKCAPLAIFKPHDGQPVNSVSFLTAPHRPEHIVLITAGPLNREVKIWVSTNEGGWLVSSESESWQCTQSLELRSSSEPRHEEAFFNQVVVLPRSCLIILANAKRNAIYAVHVDYGHFPAATRMDYIADFTVAMPILSLTGTDESSEGDQLVQVYCVQTQAIQQYALDLSQCLPATDNVCLVKDTSLPRISETHSLEAISMVDATMSMTSSHPGESMVNVSYPISSSKSASSDIPEAISVHEFASPIMDLKPSAPPLSSADVDNTNSLAFSAPLTVAPLTGAPSFSRSPSTGFEQGTGRVGRNDDQTINYSVEGRVDAGITNFVNVPSTGEASGKNELKVGASDIPLVSSPRLRANHGGNTTHLITPFEILSGAISTETSPIPQVPKGEETKDKCPIANSNADNEAAKDKIVENGVSQLVEPPFLKEQEFLPERIECSDTSEAIVSEGDFPLPTSTYSTEEVHPVVNVTVSEPVEQPFSALNEEDQGRLDDVSEKSFQLDAQIPSTNWGEKQKVKQSQTLGPLSPSPSPFNSMESLNEPGSSVGSLSLDAVSFKISTMQETLNQLMTMQKEMQKQISAMVASPVTKEGKRVEAALGRNMEKAIKANVDALWARVQEENAKYEKAERDRVQQMTNLITNFVNKDLSSVLERTLKKEISSLGPNLARTVTPVVEKAISSAIVDTFQRGVGDKAVGQLEKSISSKLETTTARQIQAQFQTSGKQALQEALRTIMESSVIPAFEASCKAMFDQVNTAFHKGMIEHTNAAQQKLDAAYTPLAVTLRDAINSASSITKNVSAELVDGQRKLLAVVAAGNSKASHPMALQPNNGPLGGVLELVEAPLDPTKELTGLISECKFGEAFTLALQRSDVSIVSWLCSQVDLHAICSPSNLPSPLSQGVLLSLLQQLACDIANDTSRKLDWMTDVAAAINPVDPSISAHVRRIVEQVYNLLNMQRSQPMTSTTDASKIRILMHVLTSILMSCK